MLTATRWSPAPMLRSMSVAAGTREAILRGPPEAPLRAVPERSQESVAKQAVRPITNRRFRGARREEGARNSDGHECAFCVQ